MFFVCFHVCMHVCGDQRLRLGVTFHSFLFFILSIYQSIDRLIDRPTYLPTYLFFDAGAHCSNPSLKCLT